MAKDLEKKMEIIEKVIRNLEEVKKDLKKYPDVSIVLNMASSEEFEEYKKLLEKGSKIDYWGKISYLGSSEELEKINKNYELLMRKKNA